MKPACLIVDKMHESIIDQMNEIGWHVDYRPDISRQQIIEEIGAYEGLIIRSKTVLDRPVIEKASNLKFVARAGAGLDKLEVNTLEAFNIKIINAPEGNCDAVAEHALGMLLCLVNNIHKSHQEVINYKWKREANRGIEVNGKTVGIIGYGHMGQAFAERLPCLGVNILVYDRYKRNISNDKVKEVTLDELYEKADIISLHIPLNQETLHQVDRNFLDNFKKNIILINTSRGEVVKTSDLITKMQEGKVWGAALDVLENEVLNSLNHEQKEAFEYLINKPNVLLTPHIAGWTHESYKKINDVIVSKVKNMNIT